MPTRNYSDSEYENDFKGDKHKEAFEQALDIRKFEINLYWKRATYFWTFIAATLAGFGALQATSIQNKDDLSVILACLGIVFSFGWLCVNRGSKYWQENWENHVDMLEDESTGPLYKVILTRSDPSGFKEWIDHAITGPSPISVSKVNQIISLYVTVLWVCLLIYSLPAFYMDAQVNWLYVIIIGITFITCVLFVTYGKTYMGGYKHKATIRTSYIDNDD